MGKEVNIDLYDFSKTAFKKYANAVIHERALPNVYDGLKPVQRRSLFAFYPERTSNVFIKSAKMVGRILSETHPHGDSSIYSSMVSMVHLPLSPFVPQGNFGNDANELEAAAMRYTELKLSEIGKSMLSALSENCVDIEPNYDGTIDVPKFLPVPFHNLLINGSEGIAVGFRVFIPPHDAKNITEVLISYLTDAHIKKKPKPDAEYINMLTPPILGEGCIVTVSPEEKLKIYTTGLGNMVSSATITKVDKKTLLISSLPSGVRPNAIMEQIQSKNSDDGVLNLVREITNESDTEIRLYIRCANNVVLDDMIELLYKHTSMRTTYSIAFNGIYNESLVTFGLIDSLRWFTEFRFDVIQRQLKFNLNKYEKLWLRYDAISKALSKIQDIVKILESDKPEQEIRAAIIKLLSLTYPEQVEYILDIKLQKLMKLEKDDVIKQRDNYANEVTSIKSVLSDDVNIYKIIINEQKSFLKVVSKR